MDRLWAPWRLEYVASAKPHSPEDQCFICAGLNEANDRQNLIVRRTARSAIFLNRFPYNNGHLLIAPQAHKGKLGDLERKEMLDTMQTLNLAIDVLEELFHPEGYNVGLNLGRVAGAGLPGHLHWHVVPRWNGDTNFMPVLADTKVISQSLDALYDLMTDRIRVL